MKKYLFITGVFSFFILVNLSCKKDRDVNPEIDAIVGDWIISDLLFNSVSVKDALLEDDPCQAQNLITFIENGTFLQKQYTTGTSGSCVLDEEDHGTWRKISADTYSMEIDGDLIEAKVTFSGKNKFTMVYKDSEFDVTFTFVYERV